MLVLHRFCPFKTQIGFLLATHMWVCFGFAHICPTCALCGVYVGLHYVCPCVSNMGFMWSTHNFGLHRFAHWRSTMALRGLQNVSLLWFDHVYLTWIMRATHMWVCLCVSNIGFIWATYTHVCTRNFAHTYQKTLCIARVSKIIPTHTKPPLYIYT